MSVRIAFFTTEFPLTGKTGGLGSYLDKVVDMLSSSGHAAEVFVISDKHKTHVVNEGLSVHEFPMLSGVLIRILYKVLSLRFLRELKTPFRCLHMAYTVHRAFRQRSKTVAFSLVQAPNNYSLGLFTKLFSRTPVVVRLSSHRKLWDSMDGKFTLGRKLRYRLELACIKRADLVMAPSSFLATYYQREHSIAVQVSRPVQMPMLPEAGEATGERYFVHIGHLGRRKGTDIVVDVMLQVWQHVPDAVIYFIGSPIHEQDVDSYKARLEGHGKFYFLGKLPRTKTLRYMYHALGVIIPSRVDNCPNVALESLQLGTPVFTIDGGSVDELITQGQNGWTCPESSLEPLVHVLADVWRGTRVFNRQLISQSLDQEFGNPANALKNLMVLYNKVLHTQSQ